MELYLLTINVTGQKLSLTESADIYSGDKNIDSVQFVFTDSKWDSMTEKWAIFKRYGSDEYQVSLDETNKAVIPAEVMQTKGYIYIGLLGTDGDEDVQTSSVLQYKLGEGVINENGITPPGDIYSQFIADLNAYQTAVSDLASIESRLTTAETTVTNLESRVATAETTVSDMEDTVDGIVSDVSGLRTTVDGLQTDVTNLQTSVSALESAVPTLQRDVSALQTGVTNLESRMTALSTSVGSLEDRLSAVQTELTDLEDGLTDAEGRLTTIGNQITDAQTDIEEIETAIEQDNIVTDVTGGGVSFVDNHVADLSFMTVTDTASGSIATFPDGSGLNAVATEIQIEPKQAGSGTPSPDNVREISGWSSVGVESVGKNLFDLSKAFVSTYNNVAGYQFTNLSTETVTVTNSGVSVSVSSGWRGATLTTYSLPAGTYHLHAVIPDSNSRCTTYLLDKDYVVVQRLGNYTISYTIDGNVTLEEGQRIAISIASTATGTITIEGLQFELGTTATAYEPYNGITTTINLGQTVYGATIYPEEGRGVITMGTVTLDGVTPRQRFTGAWGSTSNGYAVYWNQDIPRTANAISDNFFFSGNGYDYMPLGSFMGGSGVVGTWSFILPSSVTNFSEANAWLAENPTIVCYQLATPIEFTFPSVSIPTLNGTNNIWADSGDISIEYIANLKKYIEKVVGS